MSNVSPYHSVIIGAGPGGLTVAVGLAGFGKRVALIEKQHIGGDCTNVGCVPSKTLIHLAQHAQAGQLPAGILEKVRAKRDALREEETAWINSLDGLDVYSGQARIASPTQVDIHSAAGEAQQLVTKNIIIATGAQARRISVPGLPEAKTLTNDSLFEQEDIPKHLAILGAGPIGTEMAFAFRQLGSAVSVIDMAEAPLRVVGKEASQVIAASMQARDIALYMAAKTLRYEPEDESLVLEQHGREVSLSGVDKVLMAVGRVPATQDIGLEQCGVKVERGGIPVNIHGATNIKGIYAIGDVSTASRFTHSANAQGRRLVKHLALPWLPTWGKEPSYPSATFSDPEVATIGANEEALQQRYHPKVLMTLQVNLKDTDKGYTEGLEQGFVRIHAMRLTGRILAATIVAPKASEMISLLTLALYQGISLYKLSNLVIPYPSLSEAIKKAADNYTFATLPKLPQELTTYLRYRWAKPAPLAEQTKPPKPREQTA